MLRGKVDFTVPSIEMVNSMLPGKIAVSVIIETGSLRTRIGN